MNLKSIATVGLLCALAIASPAFAQDVAPSAPADAPPPPAEAPRCGGLLCDFGVFGTHADAAPPPQAAPEPVVAEPAVPVKKVRKKKRVAKVAPKAEPAAATPN